MEGITEARYEEKVIDQTLNIQGNEISCICMVQIRLNTSLKFLEQNRI